MTKKVVSLNICQKASVENTQKNVFFFLSSAALNIHSVEGAKKVVNTGDEKGMKVSCKLNFRRSKC